MDWKVQTYYEARIGRRVFRVGELVVMARASGLPAWTFLDADGITKTVNPGIGSEVSITSSALLDLFQAPIKSGEVRHRLNIALGNIRKVLDNLIGPDASRPTGTLARDLYVAARLIEQEVSKK
jgi:hypothetical protein